MQKWTFFIATKSVASWLHSAWTTACAFRGTLKSFPYIWGYWIRSIHKYKCLFYQTNAYQTSVIGRCAHNKEVWLVHVVLWTLSSTAEIKNIFTAAIDVSLCKPLPAAVKTSREILQWRLDFIESLIIQHFKWLHEPGNEENYKKELHVLPKQRGPDESLLNHLAGSQQLETLKSWKKQNFLSLYTDTYQYSIVHPRMFWLWSVITLFIPLGTHYKYKYMVKYENDATHVTATYQCINAGKNKYITAISF